MLILIALVIFIDILVIKHYRSVLSRYYLLSALVIIPYLIVYFHAPLTENFDYREIIYIVEMIFLASPVVIIVATVLLLVYAKYLYKRNNVS